MKFKKKMEINKWIFKKERKKTEGNVLVFVDKIRKLKTINQKPIYQKESENLVSLQTTKLVCF